MTKTSPPAPHAITPGRVSAIALPVVLSNATIPLQGAIDTAIIGNLGDAVYLAAVTLGATVITLVLMSFNFLQMGTSGLAAQALGAGDGRRVIDTLVRALILAIGVAALIALSAGLLARAGLALFEGSADAEEIATGYIVIRAWGAPAELANYALIGWFTGQELTRRLFEMQIVTSVCNVALNFLFVLGFGWGVEGVALGTVIAMFAGLGLGLWRARQRVRGLAPGWRPDWPRILSGEALRRLMALNRDIFIRTCCLTFGFAWMARLGSLQGDTVLAANGVLMQFVHVSAHALDGFAMAAETLVGQALGARDRLALRRSVVVSGASALVLAALFSLAASLLAAPLINLFTNVEAVRQIALEHALWATCLPLVGVLAYQMDGIFIGAADGRGMRNAMLVAVTLYMPAGWALGTVMGNDGIWLALWLWMLLRAGALAWRYPALEARTGGIAAGT